MFDITSIWFNVKAQISEALTDIYLRAALGLMFMGVGLWLIFLTM
jgi:hypothetical protein